MTKRFCCCCTNLEATRILAILLIVFRTIYIITKFTYIYELEVDSNRVDNNNANLDTEVIEFRAAKYSNIAIFALQCLLLIMDFCLLIGSIREVPKLLSIWFAVTVLSIPIMGAFMVYWMFAGYYYEILLSVIEVVFIVWIMIVVYGAVQEI